MFKKLIKSLSFSIGSLNKGWFGFSFWPVTAFSISIKIGKHRFCVGEWSTDGSNPKEFPMINRVGWLYSRYYPVIQIDRSFGPAIVWKPCMSDYYGYNFGRSWNFSHTIFPCPPGSSLTPEDQKIYDEMDKYYQDSGMALLS